MSKMASPLAITMGDPNGIGPEIVLKSFARGISTPAIVIGDAALLARLNAKLGLRLNITSFDELEGYGTTQGAVHVLNASALPADLHLGTVDARAGQASFDYVVKAIELANAKRISGIVTAPIAKEAMKKAGLTYPGHTEILAEKSGTQDFAMMLANDELRVILVTIHVALAAVPKLVTRERVLNTIRLADRACRAYGIAKPRIAVAGLNPHAGEDGMFGREDLDEIAPAIHDAREEDLNVTGPWPGDTVFMRARKGEFDIVVAQYHDQGLIPVKYMGIEQGVNVTVGLPFVRTSVDHGTAFDIAAHFKADPASLIYAIEQARKLVVAESAAQ
jgi:4-hydroxythreonine-4-phosphate dehydrogenase